MRQVSATDPPILIQMPESDNTGTVMVATLGILGTLLAPIVTNWLASRRDDKRWRREQRLTAYSDFVEKSLYFQLSIVGMRQRQAEGYDEYTALLRADKLYSELSDLHTRISVVGSEQVRQATKQYLSEASEAMQAVWDDPETWLLGRLATTDKLVTKYIREDLGTKEANEKRQKTRARRDYLQLTPYKYLELETKQWMLRNWKWYRKYDDARVRADIAAGKYNKPEGATTDEGK